MHANVFFSHTATMKRCFFLHSFFTFGVCCWCGWDRKKRERIKWIYLKAPIIIKKHKYLIRIPFSIVFLSLPCLTFSFVFGIYVPLGKYEISSFFFKKSCCGNVWNRNPWITTEEKTIHQTFTECNTLLLSISKFFFYK